VELLERKESVVNRVATRSSTRNQPDSRVRRTRSRKKPCCSDSDRNEVAPEPTRPAVHVEKGVEENQLPIDISSEVGRAITDSNPRIVPKTVRFDDFPVIIKSCSLKSILFKNNPGNTIVERFFWGRLD
jgi:Fe-S-cluster formation regulator IscX/YfhJ